MAEGFDPRGNTEGQRIRRRGLIAGAAALVAGIVAQRTAQPVTATSGTGPDGTFILGSNFNVGNTPNTATMGSYIAAAPSFTGTQIFVAHAPNNSGTGTLNVGGVVGAGRRQGFGVYGVSGDTGGTFSNPAPYPAYNSGVYGLGVNSATGVTGVSASNYGVYGISGTGIGARGDTAAAGSFGVLGTTTAANSIALGGIATANGSSCFSGGTANPNAFAAFFQGHVQVTDGAFDVIPMGNKHGLALHPDGTHRTFYSVESPECWVEDFGEGTLTAGKTAIALDKDFAALIHTDLYHVFLTGQGAHHHLIVNGKTATGFNVEADAELAALKGKKASDLNGKFAWRVVARRKTTAKVDRLAKATVGNFKFPTLDELPKPPTLPKQ